MLRSPLCRLVHCISKPISHRRWLCSATDSISSDFLLEELEKRWDPPKNGTTKRDLTVTPIPCTIDWTIEELKYLQLHYCQVNPSDWSLYLCDEAPLTEQAETISDSSVNPRGVLQSDHFDKPYLERQFGELVYGALVLNRTKAITDRLVGYLLGVCNPSPALYPEPRVTEFTIKVGNSSFKSIPDATVEVRLPSLNLIAPSLVVVKDKISLPNELERTKQSVEDPLHPKDYKKRLQNLKPKPHQAKFQLPGEMLAAALRNYRSHKFSQTVFGLRGVGTQFTFYRADFPEHYLESVTKDSVPNGHITIFRVGGSDKPDDAGLPIEFPGEGRKQTIRWLCNVMDACTQIAEMMTEGNIAPITEARIKQLYPKQ